MSFVKDVVDGKCPNCSRGEVFEKKANFFSFPKMKESCTECNHRFEIEPGYFFGAMYVCYGLVVAEVVAAYIIISLFLDSLPITLILLSVVTVSMSFINFKYARLIWMYLFKKEKDVVDVKR